MRGFYFMNHYYAYKTGNTHVYNADGKRLLVTKLVANPLTVTQIKNVEKDGYDAIQVGLGIKKRTNKPESGKQKQVGFTPKVSKEIKLEEVVEKNVKDQININEVIAVGDIVNVYATSKGKGFAGGVKRWGFAGGPKTHGQSDRHRAPGSIGQGTTPGRVWKGKKMAGQMGAKNTCVRNGQVVSINQETNEILVTGTVPGPKGGLVKIKKIKSKDFNGLWNKKEEKQEENK